MSRALAVLLCVASACQFRPSGDGGEDAPPGLDAAEVDGAEVDGAAADGAAADGAELDAAIVDAIVDAPDDAAADAAVDARSCPTAPAGCTAFTCAGSTSCYYVCNAQSWTSARDRCVSADLGCLATIDSDAENTCIAGATNPTFPNVVWFGWRQSASGQEPAGGWGWECGSSSFVAGNWGDFEPNNSGGNEDCGAMAQGGAWIDGGCGTSLRFVCERP